jgi:hypothetical protein
VRCHSRSLAILTFLLFGSATAPALAAVPSPANSTVQACLTACPLGDSPFVVVVRDLGNNPVPSSTVTLDFVNCPAAYICTGPGFLPDSILVDEPNRSLRVITPANGIAYFPLRVGGVCAAGTVRVFADGVLLAQRALASADQDGDGFSVNFFGGDVELFEPKLGTNDPTADFDCDGDVDVDDESLFYMHGSHACHGFVDPEKRSSWGRVKSIYR